MSQVAQDAWEQLNADQPAKPKANKLQAILSGNLGKTSTKKKKKKSNKNDKEKLEKYIIGNKKQDVEQGPTKLSDDGTDKENNKRTTKSSIALPENVLASSEMILRIIQRDINLIASDNIGDRKRSLERLGELFFPNQDEEKSIIKKEDVLEELFQELQKPLLRRLADPSEKCRELSIVLLTKFLNQCQDMGHILPYLFPALMERNSQSFVFDFEAKEMVRDVELHEAKQRGKAVPLPDAGSTFVHQVAEPSEEIRLLLCEMLGALVNSLISRDLHSMLGPYFHDTVMFFHACAVDPFPDLRFRGLEWLQKLAKEERLANTMHHYCTALIRSIMPSLRHRQFRIRVVAINAVGALVSCPNRNKQRGGGSEAINDLCGYREDNVVPLCAFYQGETRINYFGHLVTDSNGTVRLAFFQIVSDWMTKLLDRWDHAARLLPFLLSSLSDELEEIQKLGLATLEELGKQYEEEHHDEIMERRQYGVDGVHSIANYELPLPSPWTARPRIGTRRYVRQHSRRFLGTVLRELGDWRSHTKKYAISLLRTVLVYTEEGITMQLHLLLQTLNGLVMDEEIGDQVKECCAIAGRFVDPEAYVPLLLKQVDAQIVDWVGTARELTVLNQMLSGSKVSRVLPHFVTITNAISAQSLVRESREHPTLKDVHILVLKRMCSFLRDEKGTRAAMDAHFIATGRLNSLQKQFESLLFLSLELDDKESFAIASQNRECRPFPTVGRKLCDVDDPVMKLDILCNFLKFTPQEEKSDMIGPVLHLCCDVVEKENDRCLEENNALAPVRLEYLSKLFEHGNVEGGEAHDNSLKQRINKVFLQPEKTNLFSSEEGEEKKRKLCSGKRAEQWLNIYSSILQLHDDDEIIQELRTQLSNIRINNN